MNIFQYSYILFLIFLSVQNIDDRPGRMASPIEVIARFI